jgi:hypothetical protein
MALTDFFRINLPYGIARNTDGEWMAFNREYLPIGFNNKKNSYSFDINTKSEFPVQTSYKGLTEKFLVKLAWDEEKGIKRDKKGEIITVFFYNDATNPLNQAKERPDLWKQYFSKIQLLANKEIKG